MSVGHAQWMEGESMSYFVFVDNSNVWIEGKVASAVARGFALNPYDAHQKGIEDSSWRID